MFLNFGRQGLPCAQRERRAGGKRALGAMAALALAGCADNVPDRAEYRLVFEDDFNGTALDSAKWTAAQGDGHPSLGAGGPLFRADNAAVQDGSLFIAGGQDSTGGTLSGAVHSAGKFAFRYGRVEVGARVPAGAGFTASVRLLPAQAAYGPWPMSGEIGIVEGFVDQTGHPGVRGVTRYGLSVPPHHGASSAYPVASPAAELVEYALEWSPGELRFSVDGEHVQTQSASQWYTYYPAATDGRHDPLGVYRRGPFGAPFDRPFHVAFGLVAADSASAPGRLQVDYVRVYECADAAVSRCGSRATGVPVLPDNAGGPLADAPTGAPFRERINLYGDGPATVTIATPAATVQSNVRAEFATDAMAVVMSDPAAKDPEDDDNTVWRVSVNGGVGEARLAAENVAASGQAVTGFDFSGHRLPGIGGHPVGEIAFDMRVESLAANATLSAGLSSGYPPMRLPAEGVGERRFELPRAALAIGEWKSYSVKFQDLADASDENCCGVDFSRVDRPFVLRANGDAKLLLDNIRVTNACRVVDACGADAAEVPAVRRACAERGTTLRFGFYAFFAPVSHSAEEDPEAPGYNTHRGFEADLVTALEALEGAGLAFARRPIGFWTGIWLQSATANFDVVGGGITILDSRTRNAAGETVVRFTDGHIAFRQSLLVRAEDAERLATHAKLTSDVRVGVLADTTGEARLLQLTGLADDDGVLAAGTRIETPAGTVIADGTGAFRITSAVVTDNVVGRTRLVPPDDAKPQVIYLGAELGERELLDALRDSAIDAVARGEIGNSDAATIAAGDFVVTGIDPVSEFGGFTVAADNADLLQCLNDKIRWLTNGGRIGYAQWRQNPEVFLEQAARWSRL